MNTPGHKETPHSASVGGTITLRPNVEDSTPYSEKEQALIWRGLLARGYALFLKQPNSKRPQPFVAWSTDSATTWDVFKARYSANRGANVGINTGASGLVVLDIDVSGGKRGDKAYAALLARHNKQHEHTYTVRTPSGGTHYHYKARPGFAVRKGDSVLAEHVDHKGLGGCVMAPGSVIDGQAYVVVHDVEPAVLPLWLAELLCASQGPVTTARVPFTAPGDVKAAQARIAVLCEEIASAPEGSGNDTVNRCAFMIGQLVSGNGDSEELHTAAWDGIDAALGSWSYARALDEEATQRTARLAFDRGTAQPLAWEAPSVQAVNPALYVDAAPAASVPVMPLTDWEKEPDWHTDEGMAGNLLRSVPGVRYVSGTGWRKWDGQRWVAAEDSAIHRPLSALVRERSAYWQAQKAATLAAYTKAKGSPEGLVGVLDGAGEDATLDKLKAAALHAKFCAKEYTQRLSHRNMRAVVSRAQDTYSLGCDDFDTDSHLVNTPSGLVDLRDGTLTAHNGMPYVTNTTRGDYRPDLPPTADWEQVLSCQPDPEVREYLQKRLGGALLGIPTPSADLLVFYGAGGNGKSLLTDALSHAVGGYASPVDRRLLTSNGQNGDQSHLHKFSLMGVRMGFIEELESERIDIMAVKEIVGCRTLRARQMYQQPVTFAATHSLIVNTNHQINMRQVDEGSWDRITVIPFNTRFVGALADPGLADRLGSKENLDAIVTWLIDGAMKYLDDPEIAKRGHPLPAALAQATENARDDASALHEFMDSIEPCTDSHITKADLYSSFKQFRKEYGAAHMGKDTFDSLFKAHNLFKAWGVSESRAYDTGRSPLKDAEYRDIMASSKSGRQRAWLGVKFKTASASSSADIFSE